MRVRSTDGDATLTLATAAKGESAGMEMKADNRVATVRLVGDRVIISAPAGGGGVRVDGGGERSRPCPLKHAPHTFGFARESRLLHSTVSPP